MAILLYGEIKDLERDTSTVMNKSDALWYYYANIKSFSCERNVANGVCFPKLPVMTLFMWNLKDRGNEYCQFSHFIGGESKPRGLFIVPRGTLLCLYLQ